MEKISDEQLKRECVFHSYGRFANIRDIINANRKNEEVFRVLDVGGRGNMLRKFLPQDNVFYLDPYVDSQDDNYISGDGCEIPLDDNSFDWVVSADVFEHIPKNKREQFLKENIRVAKMGIILVAPLYSKEVYQAEVNTNENYKKLFDNQDHPWLKEHLENGLPKEKEIEDFLHSHNYAFQKLHNNWLFLWQLLIGTEFFIDSNQDEKTKEENQKFNLFYNEKIFPFDNQEPSYRKIYFIKKHKELKNFSQKKQGAITNILLLELIKKRLDLIAEVNNSHNFIFQQKEQTIQQKDSEIQQKEQAIQQKDNAIRKVQDLILQKEQVIQDKEKVIEEKNKETWQKNELIQQTKNFIQQKDDLLRQKESEIETMKSSKFWILRNRYIKLKYFRPKHFIQLASKALEIISAGKFQKFWWAMKKYVIYGWDYFKPKKRPKTDYEKWIEKNEKLNKKEIEKEIEGFGYKPKISIITPVYNVDPKWLNKCVESVRNQFYKNWELCLHDDASTKKETIECLEKWKKKGDARIKISFGKENQHISGASNEALKLATGEFVALLDNDDELSPDALYENVKLLNEYPEADFIYSDEDKIKMDGRRVDPFFKPDWSREFFLTTMYTCHLGIYRKSIVDEINGFRKGFEGSQDYDLVLRFIEKVDHKRIFHISKILYHWRKIEGSTAQKTNSKNYAYIAGKKALVDYLERNNISGNVEDGISPGAFRIKRNLKNHPLVSIIIPTKDKIDYLRPCVLSIVKKTDYPNVEIIIIDTGSREKATYDFYDEIKNDEKIKIIDYQKSEFNFAEANNWAAQKVKGKYLLFLNNDTEVINADWLTSMMEYAQLKDVGVVGSKLLFPNNTIQHMGVVIGLRGGASHAGICFPEWQFMGFPFLHAKDVVRDVSSVTAACLLIRKKIFDKVNGFNEKFKIAFNDTDLCLKVKKLGYKIIYTPYAKLIHHESVSFGRPYDDPRRSNDLFEKERRIFNSKWKISEDYHDPFYNVNLTTRNENLSLKI